MSEHKFGYVALIGAPNVGKSTLLNQMVGQKISITSRRPQTTRHRILGICSEPDYQVVFVDTPGLHSDQKKSLNRVINKTAITSMSDVDLIIFMIDHKGWTPAMTGAFDKAKSKSTPIMLFINKIDQLKDKSGLLPLIEQSSKLHDFVDIVPVSALKLKDREGLMDLITGNLLPGPPGFPEEQVTDRSQRFMASEFVREQTFLSLGQELPYSIAVEISRYQEGDNGVLNIDAVIWVEKTGQKSIVIGKDGQQLKLIGTRARVQMEKVFGQKVFLNLWVKVKKGWGDQENLLRSLGYSED
jgi:GTP-binding protein Era